jgi:hypothetical protein
MTPVPRMSDVAPFRWVGAVVLSPDDVEELINELPPDNHMAAQLRDAARAAATLAMRLNAIERGRAA